ncbi:hypothetical protein QUA00_16980 [Microcoleus sp. T2B6]|uniref:type II toxin-antitoxin system RelN family antitoxin n=1 Tax=Microcoleus sp. T2B6 TaxID=3055424 RepID=UPI002FD180A3
MKAFEVTGTIDEKGQLILDRPLTLDTLGPVRIIVLLPEPTDEDEDDPNDTPVEEVKASLRRSLQQAKAGQRIPLSQMWEGIDRF